MLEVQTKIKGHTGFISLNRPKALNALNLSMIRALTAQLIAWKDDAAVKQVAIRGMSKPAADGSEVAFGSFCAGGDIRFFHQAALAGNPELEDFFTEEYSLNHLVANYPKPYIAFMDGIVMGGGMGLSQGGSHRIVTERTKMAMPETGIGLFPDVGGGYFLSRCPGSVGEYLALTGAVIGADDAVAYGLADIQVNSTELTQLWESLATLEVKDSAINKIANKSINTSTRDEINSVFSLSTVSAMMNALEASNSAWAQQTAKTLRSRSPLMLHVVLEQIRRGRHLNLTQNLQMERGMVRHCFYTAHLSRFGADSETVEGIRALAVDKDHQPRWKPSRIEELTTAMVAPFFVSPWPDFAHPLAHLTHLSKD